MICELAVSAGNVQNAGIIGNELVEPATQDVPNGLASRFAIGKTAAIDIIERQRARHQIPPMRICSSIHGITSSRIASREVVARNPRSRAAFSTSGTRFWTSYLNGLSET